MITAEEKAAFMLASPNALELVKGEINDRRFWIAAGLELEYKLSKTEIELLIIKKKYEIVCAENAKLRDELLTFQVKQQLKVCSLPEDSPVVTPVPEPVVEQQEQQSGTDSVVESVEPVVEPVVEPAKRKRTKKEKEGFEFQERTDKTLSKATLANYKRFLNEIYSIALQKHQEDETKVTIKNKDDLLNHADYVISIIKEITTDRMKICGIFSAIFYVLGRQDFNQDKRGEAYTLEFRKSYYDKKYKEKLVEEGKLPAEDV